MPLVYEKSVHAPAAISGVNAPDHTLIDWQTAPIFFGLVAKVMRRILVQNARPHRAAQRVGEQTRFETGDARRRGCPIRPITSLPPLDWKRLGDKKADC